MAASTSHLAPAGVRPGRKRVSVALPVAMIALAALLRFSFLGDQSYWFDETVTVKLLHLSFGDMLHGVYEGESTPPLYYSVAWLWAKLFGTGELELRLLSAFAGTGFVVAAYLTGRELVSERAGLIVAGLAAVNPLLVYYSQEARAYAFLMLFGGLSLLGFVYSRERGDRRALIGWALASALAMASHYYAFFLVVPEAGYLLARHRRRVLPAVAAVLAVGLALLPLALHQRGLDHASFLRTASLLDRLAQVPKQFLVGFQGPAEVPVAVAAGGLALVGVVLALREGYRERRAALMAAALAVIPLALPVLIDPDTFGARNCLAAWLPAALVVAIGFAGRDRRLGVVLAAILAALCLITTLAVNTDPARRRDDWRGAARVLPPLPPGGRIVVVNPSDGGTPLSLYLPGLRRLPLGGADVREVVAIAIAPGGPGTNELPPRPDPPFRPPAPMGLVRLIYTRSYSVAIFGSRKPVRLTDRSLPPLAPLEPASRFLQPR